ncbi:LicD family protein [Pedobacter sandarakinus]|uniref:LicD family protein n=1 Tax=Pedobacter sandarakinus TaxID=353156 RepID=UPI002245DD95|nr:LicD family protein [Pedobacter sandarakinus]MCX2574027.1 LicD family protein [Pedobacter sandarakinus]
MTTINTTKGEFFFERPAFSYGSKTINRERAKENLFLFKEILDKSKVKFLLAYGTLLGAIREGNFIEHDFDTDFIILEEDRASFLDLLFELSNAGFVVGRYENDLISLIRKEEYIDIYFFRKHLFFYRKSAYYDDNTDIYYTYNRFLTKTTTLTFLGETFSIPKDFDAYLKHCYGENWRTPIQNLHGVDFKLNQKIKAFLRKYFYGVYALLKQAKKYLKPGTDLMDL